MLPTATSQPTQVITPAVAPAVVDTINVMTSADFLWWKSYLDGMEYAESGVQDGAENTALSVSTGKVKNPAFRFAPGVKASLGFAYRLDGWDTTAVYTGIYSNKKHAQVSYDANKGLLANFTGNPLNYASCGWKQRFNALDLELGRNFFISRTLTLRPNFGAKLSWIKEEFDILYDNNFTDFNSLGNLTFKQKQWGIGARAALDTVWHFTKCFGIYGDIAGTALWSSFKTTYLDVATSPTSINTIENYEEKVFRVVPVLEVALGFEAMAWFNNDMCLFFGRVGWEGQIWVNFNQLFYPAARLHGDLSLQGLTVRLGFSY